MSSRKIIALSFCLLWVTSCGLKDLTNDSSITAPSNQPVKDWVQPGMGQIPASISFDPADDVVLSSVMVGTTGIAQNFDVKNIGEFATDPCDLATISGTNAAEFILTGADSCTVGVDASSTCSGIAVAAKPKSTGEKTAYLELACGSLKQVVSLSYTAQASPVPASIQLNPSSFAFANTKVGASSAAKIFVAQNPGDVSIASCSNATISGTNASEFVLSGANSCSSGIAAKGSCSGITVTAKPTSLGEKMASLNLVCGGLNKSAALSYTSPAATLSSFNPAYPRLMGINFGGSFSDATYQRDLAKHNVVVIGMYPEWNNAADKMGAMLKTIKAYNPNELIINYSIFNDTTDASVATMNKDISDYVEANDLWLRNAAGQRVQLTNPWNYWTINVTTWAKTVGGLRFPEWRVKRDNEKFFKNYPQFDGMYVDITNFKPTIASADYKRNGTNQANTDATVQAAYRAGQAAGWDYFRTLQPEKIIMGNVDHNIDSTEPEYINKLNGAFMETLVGADWSLMNAVDGWNKVMTRYHTNMTNTLAPKLVGFGFRGAPNDYKTMRFGLTSCLMDNGYYAYSNISTGYTQVMWFDEFDVKLGYPVDPVQTAAWKSGVYRRNYAYGTVLVNPTAAAVTVTIEAGYKRIAGIQDPITNDGMAATTITIAANDGIILLKN